MMSNGNVKQLTHVDERRREYAGAFNVIHWKLTEMRIEESNWHETAIR